MAQKKYNIQYLPSFSEELDGIVYYITYVLKNKQAAERLIDNVSRAIISRSEAPESFEIYKSEKKRKYNG